MSSLTRLRSRGHDAAAALVALCGCADGALTIAPPTIDPRTQSVVLASYADRWTSAAFGPEQPWTIEATDPTEVVLFEYARPPSELTPGACLLLEPLAAHRLRLPLEPWQQVALPLEDDLARALVASPELCTPCATISYESRAIQADGIPSMLVDLGDGHALLGFTTGAMFRVDAELGIEPVATSTRTIVDGATDDDHDVWILTATGTIARGRPETGFRSIASAVQRVGGQARAAWFDGHLYVASVRRDEETVVEGSFARYDETRAELIADWAGPLERQARGLVAVGGGSVWAGGAPSGSLLEWRGGTKIVHASPTQGGFSAVGWIPSLAGVAVMARRDPIQVVRLDRSVDPLTDSIVGFDFYEVFETPRGLVSFGGDPVIQEYVTGFGSCPLVSVGGDVVFRRVIPFGDGFLIASMPREGPMATGFLVYSVRLK